MAARHHTGWRVVALHLFLEDPARRLLVGRRVHQVRPVHQPRQYRLRRAA